MSIKRKKQVRCTECTQHRWKGNKKDRHKLNRNECCGSKRRKIIVVDGVRYQVCVRCGFEEEV